MTTKQKLLDLLQSCSGDFISGEEIAEKLSVSRTAVWKAANALRSDGYEIHAVQNRGYSLDVSTDILSISGIQKHLSTENDLKLEIIQTTTSTNSVLREKAVDGVPEGTVILANEQTKGRGRLGRDFYSPPDTGIYMSILLRPVHMSPEESVSITTMAAVAACRAIDSISSKKPEIKWVNDIYISGKKVCGILTEAAIGLESGSLDYIILGIGFNIYPPAGGFPEEVASIADSILRNQEQDRKNQLSAAFLNHFFELYRNADSSAYAEEYRSRSFVIGKPIQVLSPAGTRNAFALDVDIKCRLIVRYEDGTVGRLSSSEVSIRGE